MASWKFTREKSQAGAASANQEKLVMAKTGARAVADVDRKLAHELSDCLWSVLVLARCYGLDLEREFLTTMAELERAPRPGPRRTSAARRTKPRRP